MNLADTINPTATRGSFWFPCINDLPSKNDLGVTVRTHVLDDTAPSVKPTKRTIYRRSRSFRVLAVLVEQECSRTCAYIAKKLQNDSRQIGSVLVALRKVALIDVDRTDYPALYRINVAGREALAKTQETQA